MEGNTGVENKEVPRIPLTYHHARPLKFSSFGVVKQKQPDGPIEKYSNEEKFTWMANQVGFYPLFMAVGRTEEDKYMTGYHEQWRRKWFHHEIPDENTVLFSYRKPPPNGVYSDYVNWELDFHITNNPYEYIDQDKLQRFDAKLQERVKAGELTEQEYDELSDNYLVHITGPVPRKKVRGLFRPSWNHHDWVSYATKHPHNVQYVVPELDLRLADHVSVRNQETKRRLEGLGFQYVEVERLKVRPSNFRY